MTLLAERGHSFTTTAEREIVRDIKESHRLELQELERKYCEQPGNVREITPEVARALREDLSSLEAERNHLRSMQVADLSPS